MADVILTAKEHEELVKATNLAEAGNGNRLCDIVQNEKDFDKHTQLINEMLNLNQQHIKTVELQIHDGKTPTPAPVPILNLDEVKRNENGQLLIIRSLSAGKEPIFREVYDSTNKTYLDTGSSPRPSGIVPRFIPANR